jgi:hypothetical protein
MEALGRSHEADKATYMTGVTSELLDKVPWSGKLMAIVAFVRGMARPTLTAYSLVASNIVTALLIWILHSLMTSMEGGVVDMIQDNLHQAGTQMLMPAQYEVLKDALGWKNYIDPSEVLDLIRYCVYVTLYNGSLALAWWFEARPPKWLKQAEK